MRLHLHWAPLALAAAAGTLFSATAANAQQTFSASPSPTATQERIVEYEGPNRGLLASGLFMFGVSYSASAIIAGSSSHVGDDRRYVPVAGPWMDLAARPECFGGPANMCDNETSNRVLLVFDGVFQGLGALALLSSFFVPEEDSSTSDTDEAKQKPHIHVTPTSYGAAAPGVAVFGSF